MKKIARLFGRFFPKLLIIPQSFNSSTKKDYNTKVLSDPYEYCGKFVPGTAKAILDCMRSTETHWKSFIKPYILIQSGCDKSVDPFLAIDFEEASQS
mgnify:CR=1 FL=1